MRILVLEAYYGGSHQAFLDGWQQHSEHEFTLLSLPPSKWKWRMRHGAITFARWVNERVASGESWDVLFCSDMLNLAEFSGLVDESVRRLPKVAYFHENQLTYPVQVESERDYQYCMTNITTATAADAVWFNSAFHRDEFLEAIGTFLKRMPDYRPIEVIDEIRAKSSIHPPGIVPAKRVQVQPALSAERTSPRFAPRILWAARWEHDKNPEDFFAAMKILKKKGLDFRLSVIGEQFRDQPEVFNEARYYFADQIDRWGYQPSRDEYAAALAESDIVVSTANHEFFGIGMLEAIAAGCYPLLPNRLSYPSIMESLVEDKNQSSAFLYDGTVAGLAEKLEALMVGSDCTSSSAEAMEDMRSVLQNLTQYDWPNRAAQLDRAMANFSA